MEKIIRFTFLGVFYVFLLTNIFERFVNRVSNTRLTLLGVFLILSCTVAFVIYIVKQLKDSSS